MDKELGYIIDAGIREILNRPPAPKPVVKPEPKDQDVLDRLIAAALPQTRRDFAARQKEIAKQAKQQKEDERRSLATGFSGEFEYEKGVPKF
jgi:hypothetical protein